MAPELLILAAGMGSRYGGLKQLESVGPSGETLLDYSVFDAIRAGFERVVFVIRRDFEREFRERIGRRYELLFSPLSNRAPAMSPRARPGCPLTGTAGTRFSYSYPRMPVFLRHHRDRFSASRARSCKKGVPAVPNIHLSGNLSQSAPKRQTLRIRNPMEPVRNLESNGACQNGQMAPSIIE